jgi:hypothetical protein
MPPTRPGRASKACDLCRKYKTRCYASGSSNGTCLRCKTLAQRCSLDFNHHRRSISPPIREQIDVTREDPAVRGRRSSVDDRFVYSRVRRVIINCSYRLERLERTVSALVDKLDSKLDEIAGSSNNSRPAVVEVPVPSAELDPAPVFLIRDAATDAGVHSPEQAIAQTGPQSDVISTGLVSPQTAHSLLGL